MEKRAGFEKRLHRVQHSRWVLALPPMLSIGVLLWPSTPQQFVSQIALAVFALVIGFPVVLQMPKVRVPVAVKATREGLSLDGRHVPRAQIRAALLMPTGTDESPRVRIVRRGMRRDITLAVRDFATGKKLLRTLGFHASQSAATFYTRSAVAAWKTPILPILSIVTGISLMLGLIARVPWLVVGALSGVVATMVLQLFPTKVDIGADGIGTRWLFGRRFFPWNDITAYARFSDVPLGNASRHRADVNMGIVLTLRSGEEVLFYVSDEQELDMLEERIREAEEAHDGRTAAEGASALSRGDRSMSDWIVHLRGIGAGANAGPRTAPVDHDKLFRIVEDPQADATARAAAAVALAREVDEDGRARLETAAEATVAPRLRVAIDAAARDDEAAVTEALAALEGEQDARSEAGS